MKTVGFFRELGPEPVTVYAESIEAHLAPEPLPDSAKVAEYLRHGHGLIDVMGAELDVLGSGQHLVGGASVLTDGEWLWRDDLRFYVTNYRLQLPHGFLDHVRHNHYQVPEISDQALQGAGEEAVRLLGYH
ncbi:hypothetical protein ACLQ26_23335 [Micromonospora sp. DT43]|uniref:hypothetical protein n=1 Tax=Micromonospora sp. DT43 TaxID=3393440 RepID=UPI003CF7428D